MATFHKVRAPPSWVPFSKSRPAGEDTVAHIRNFRSNAPMANLILRFEPDPTDEVGKLWFDLQTDRFSGSAFFWSNLSELPEITDELGSYPFEEPATWKWGYEAKEGPDAVLALCILQTHADGALEAKVTLSDLHDTSQRLTAKFRPDYVSLDVLRQELRAMYIQRTGEALLSGM